jgi:hypothetical protein
MSKVGLLSNSFVILSLCIMSISSTVPVGKPCMGAHREFSREKIASGRSESLHAKECSGADGRSKLISKLESTQEESGGMMRKNRSAGVWWSGRTIKIDIKVRNHKSKSIWTEKLECGGVGARTKSIWWSGCTIEAEFAIVSSHPLWFRGNRAWALIY